MVALGSVKVVKHNLLNTSDIVAKYAMVVNSRFVEYNFICRIFKIMKHTYPIKLYLKYKPNLIMLSLAVLANIFTWFWIIFRIKPQEDLIFLHYNILFGVDYIGEWWRVFYIPTIGLLILFVNFVIGWVLFSKDKFISVILNAVSVVSGVFLLVIAALLVFLNV